MTQSLCLAIWKLEFCSWATVLQTCWRTSSLPALLQTLGVVALFGLTGASLTSGTASFPVFVSAISSSEQDCPGRCLVLGTSLILCRCLDWRSHPCLRPQCQVAPVPHKASQKVPNYSGHLALHWKYLSLTTPDLIAMLHLASSHIFPSPPPPGANMGKEASQASSPSLIHPWQGYMGKLVLTNYVLGQANFCTPCQAKNIQERELSPSPAHLPWPIPIASAGTAGEEKSQVIPAKKSPCFSLAIVLATETGYAKIVSRSSDGIEKCFLSLSCAGPCSPWAVTPVHHQDNHQKAACCTARQIPNLWKTRNKS